MRWVECKLVINEVLLQDTTLNLKTGHFIA